MCLEEGEVLKVVPPGRGLNDLPWGSKDLPEGLGIWGNYID